MKSQSCLNSIKNGYMICFYRDVTAFHQSYGFSPSLFSVTQHHEKRWDPSTPYTWRNYWTVPNFTKWVSCSFRKWKITFNNFQVYHYIVFLYRFIAIPFLLYIVISFFLLISLYRSYIVIMFFLYRCIVISMYHYSYIVFSY